VNLQRLSSAAATSPRQGVEEPWQSFVTHLECSLTGQHYPADQLHNLSAAGKPLLVRYDLAKLGQNISQETLRQRSAGLWRYRELLPVRRAEHALSLGEPATPLLRLSALQPAGTLWMKDESRLPTGSFKARGLCLSVSMALELGVRHIAMPTNGNAGAALADYASLAGIRSTIFCPDDTPETNVREIAALGADVYRVNGLINDCGRIVAEGNSICGWFDMSTLKEPYRIEGKKTMGLELAEQFGWNLPDVIFYPTGGGTGLIGMWKAFQELQALGWIGPELPRMIAVQAAGCAPIVRAWQRGEQHAEFWQHAHTVAAGIRVPAAIGDFLMLSTIRESGGFAVAVDDSQILSARDQIARHEGVLICPEGAATMAAYQRALRDGLVKASDQAVLFNCATGLKYDLPPMNRRLDCRLPIDYSRFV